MSNNMERVSDGGGGGAGGGARGGGGPVIPGQQDDGSRELEILRAINLSKYQNMRVDEGHIRRSAAGYGLNPNGTVCREFIEDILGHNINLFQFEVAVDLGNALAIRNKARVMEGHWGGVAAYWSRKIDTTEPTIPNPKTPETVALPWSTPAVLAAGFCTTLSGVLLFTSVQNLEFIFKMGWARTFADPQNFLIICIGLALGALAAIDVLVLNAGE